MKLLAVLKRRPLVLPLAAVAALGMLAISESAYWLAQIGQGGATGRGGQRRLQSELRRRSRAT